MIILGYHPETFKKSKNQLRMNCIRYKIQVRDFIDKFFSGFHIVVIFSEIISSKLAAMYSSVFCSKNVIKTV